MTANRDFQSLRKANYQNTEPITKRRSLLLKYGARITKRRSLLLKTGSELLKNGVRITKTRSLAPLTPLAPLAPCFSRALFITGFMCISWQLLQNNIVDLRMVSYLLILNNLIHPAWGGQSKSKDISFVINQYFTDDIF